MQWVCCSPLSIQNEGYPLRTDLDNFYSRLLASGNSVLLREERDNSWVVQSFGISEALMLS
jgi:hypothetical protein